MAVSNRGPAGPVKQVVLVGHCGADTASLDYVVRTALGAVSISVAHDRKTAERMAGPDALLLVNRVLDYGFEGEGGIELIRALAPRGARMMLISNYAESQAQAVAVGALPGFGKSQMHEERTAKMLRDAAGAPGTPGTPGAGRK
ncbi:MAG: hypothetical protein NTW19_20885 [Planctomycetota bacterium]|nr:hypothetical protein [Planctomycetota bacterium]